jgi:8-oxo-dGTP pyrophosphatase MutT (NUDIX family)
MRERLTARVVLLDPRGRVLLMKGRPLSAPEGPGAWFPIGGGVEAGESLAEAAVREITEETGFVDFNLGPVVWVREGVLRLRGDEVVLMRESYFVATCAGGEPDRSGWDALEREMIDDIRWWSRSDLAATSERVFPMGLADHLIDILDGLYPDPPKVLA